jgi:hypothetical protein
MDVSKLPRLSKTQTPETPGDLPAPESPPTVPSESRLEATPGVGAEVWFAVILAIILMLIGRPFGSYLVATATHKPFHTGVVWSEGDKEGQEVPYLELDGHPVYSDSGPFLFGVALLVSALSQLVPVRRVGTKQIVVGLSLILMVLATAYNVYVVMKIQQFGLPIISLLCVAFGGYIAFHEWSGLKKLRMTRA